MLRKLEALALVILTDGLAVNALRSLGQRLIHQAADDLAIFEDKRHLVGAYLEHGTGTFAAARLVSETRIEETGIVNAELPNERIERHHFSGVLRGNAHGFLR